MREALRARRRTLGRLIIRDGLAHPAVEELLALARAAGVSSEQVDRATLEKFVGTEAPSQGVALEAGPIPESSLEDLLVAASRRRDASSGPPGRLLVALDGVEDPQNVGALARVADAAGVDGLILAERRAPALTPAVSRAGAGAIEWLPVARVGNLVRALESAQREGFWLVAADPDADRDLYGLPDRLLEGDLVVLLGAEGRGLRPGVLKLADHRVRLPMRGHVDSLNVSTAGAILLYEILRRAPGLPAE